MRNQGSTNQGSGFSETPPLHPHGATRHDTTQNKVFRIRGFGFKTRSRIEGSESRVEDSGFRAQILGSRAKKSIRVHERYSERDCFMNWKLFPKVLTPIA